MHLADVSNIKPPAPGVPSLFRTRRLEQHITLSEAARSIGCNQSTLSRFERGITNLGSREFLKACSLFNINVDLQESAK